MLKLTRHLYENTANMKYADYYEKALFNHRLIDESYFMIMPVIVGDGRRLMGGISLQEKLQLKLVEARTFGSGSVLLHYLKQ